MIITKKEREEVLSKIEKLIAHTKVGTNGAVNVNEMATANKIIKELMDKYDITINEIKVTSDKSTLIAKFESRLWNTKSIKPWLWELSISVANFYDCHIVKSGNKLMFIGFEMDAEVSAKMFDYLYIQINKASYMDSSSSSLTDKNRRIDFCVGAMVSLRSRLHEIKNERNSKVTENALVIVKKDVIKNEKYKMFPDLKTVKNNVKHYASESYVNGVKFGRTMKLEESKLIQK